VLQFITRTVIVTAIKTN